MTPPSPGGRTPPATGGDQCTNQCQAYGMGCKSADRIILMPYSSSDTVLG